MSVFTTLMESFHSAPLYRRVRAKQSLCLGYTLFLVALSCLLVVLTFGTKLHHEFFAVRDGKTPFFDDAVAQVAAQWPNMTLAQQKIVTQEPKATVIRLSGTLFGVPFENAPLLTIDTTGATTHQNMTTPMLLTTDELMYRSDRKTEVKSFKDLNVDEKTTLVINRAVAEDSAKSLTQFVHAMLPKLYVLLGGMMWVFATLFFYVLRLFMLVFLGLGGLIIAEVTKDKISFPAAMSLAAVAYTPVALLDTLMLIVTYQPVSTGVLILAGLVALYTAMRVSREAAPSPMIGG